MAENWSGLFKRYFGEEKDKWNNEKKPLSRASKASVARKSGGALAGVTISNVVKRFQPTYRLEPKNPINRETCEKIVKSIVNTSLKDFYYSSKEAQHLSLHISEEIKTRVKQQNFDRYRYVCIVTIGEMRMQGYSSQVNFLWDAERDSFLTYVYDTPDFFAVASLYYLYYD